MGDRDQYLFNPRDLTLWVIQLFRYEIVSVNTFLNAWAYETNRIFRDRLVGAESQDPFDWKLRNAMIQFFNARMLMWRSSVTLQWSPCNDDGEPSGDLRRILMATRKWSKRVSEYERELVPGEHGSSCVRRPGLVCIKTSTCWPLWRGPTVPGVSHRPHLTFGSLYPRDVAEQTTGNGSGISSRICR